VPGTDKGNEWKITKASPPFFPVSSETTRLTQPLRRLRPSSPTTKIPAKQSITCSPCPPAPAASAQQACASAGISPCAPAYVSLALPAFFSRPPIQLTPLTPPQLDPRVSATTCFFATDVHCRTLGPYTAANTSATAPKDSNHTIDLLRQIRGEVTLIFGLKDTHVPDAGRDLIRHKLREAGVVFSFHEFAWAQHAFIRDELSKGRYDPAVTKACFEVLLELFGRVLRVELGEPEGGVPAVEHVC